MLQQAHFYDNKLAERKKSLQRSIDRVSLLTIQEKVATFDKIAREIEVVLESDARSGEKTRQHALVFLNIIRSDLVRYGRVNSQANYDPTNDLHADDLLMLCGEILFGDALVDKLEFLALLTQQLHDMESGSCPEGRVSRLFQVVVSYGEFLTDFVPEDEVSRKVNHKDIEQEKTL